MTIQTPLVLDYACFGTPGNTPLLLIMGLATQRTAWPKEWISAFVARGFYVVSFDNRDVGLSTRLDDLGTPKLRAIVARRLCRMAPKAPYSLADMAQDTLGLLDQLKLNAAHVLGISMGGMIAQHLALMAPARVLSLTLMMTSSGYPWLPLPRWSVFKIFASKPTPGATQREVAVEYLLRLFGEIGSPAYQVPVAQRRARALEQVDRSIAGMGGMRQLAAILADAQRWRRLPSLRVATQVLHGDADKMVPIAHGHDLAKRISGASFSAIPGLGHDLPEALAHLIAERVAAIATCAT
jgi:pimeloyl-ACP methyl ester carboxylesterase